MSRRPKTAIPRTKTHPNAREKKEALAADKELVSKGPEVIDDLIKEESKHLSKPQIQDLMRSDPVVLNEVMNSLAQFAPRTQLILDIAAKHDMTYSYATAIVDTAIECVSVMSPDYAANLLTSLMLAYQSVIRRLDKELENMPEKNARQDRQKIIRLKLEALKNIQSLLPQTQIVKAEINHHVEQSGPTIGQQLMTLYNLSSPEIIEVQETEILEEENPEEN